MNELRALGAGEGERVGLWPEIGAGTDSLLEDVAGGFVSAGGSAHASPNLVPTESLAPGEPSKIPSLKYSSPRGASEMKDTNTSSSESASSGPKMITETERRRRAEARAPVCARCWEENRRLARWRLDWLCDMIPKMFGLVEDSKDILRTL